MNYSFGNRRNSGTRSLLRYFGPAWIVMIADVDVASIITGVQSGASFGYHLIFIELILTIPLAIIQYVSGGVAMFTGRGIAENIRENWGKRYAYAAALPMAFTDFLSYVAEYSGIAIGFALLGMNPVIGIIIAFVLHNALITFRRFEKVEFPLIVVSMVLVAALVIAAVLSHPVLSSIVSEGLNPVQPYGNSNYLFLTVANIGAVIMPWMIFYQAGASVEKRIGRTSARGQKWETAIGALVSELIMVAIIIASKGMSGEGSAGLFSLISAFSFLNGASHVFIAIGFISAGFLALVVISLSSAWGVCEAAGIKFRFSQKISERKGFYSIFLMESVPAVILSIVASSNLISLLINLMVIYVLVDVPVLMMVGLIVRREGMVKKKFLSRGTMFLYWIFFVIIEATGIYSILAGGISLF